MGEKINGYLYQEYEPTPDKPCEIKTTIFIDTQNMEERYGEELYKEYLENENKQLKDKLKGVQEEKDYLFNKLSIENEYLALENKQSKDKIKQLEKCYCNRSDCSGRIKDSRKYDSVVQQLDKYKEVIDKATKFYTHELFKREQLPIPENMPWESVEMFNILEGNK